jgi:hypothetical protein
MSPFVDEVERTIALARRCRTRALRTLDRLEGRRIVIGRTERPKATTCISIALTSLIACEPPRANVALNLNRRVMDR